MSSPVSPDSGGRVCAALHVALVGASHPPPPVDVEELLAVALLAVALDAGEPPAADEPPGADDPLEADDPPTPGDPPGPALALVPLAPPRPLDPLLDDAETPVPTLPPVPSIRPFPVSPCAQATTTEPTTIAVSARANREAKPEATAAR